MILLTNATQLFSEEIRNEKTVVTSIETMNGPKQSLILNEQARSHAKRPCTSRDCGRLLKVGETVYKTMYAFKHHKQCVCGTCVENSYVDKGKR